MGAGWEGDLWMKAWREKDVDRVGKELSGRKKHDYRYPEARSCSTCQRTAKRPVKQEKDKSEGRWTVREDVDVKGRGLQGHGFYLSRERKPKTWVSSLSNHNWTWHVAVECLVARQVSWLFMTASLAVHDFMIMDHNWVNKPPVIMHGRFSFA